MTTIATDFQLLATNNILDCFAKYKNYLAKYLYKQGLDFEDAGQEAFIVFAETVKNIDLARVTDQQHWSLLIFLRSTLCRRFKKSQKQLKLQNATINSDTSALVENLADDRSRSFADVVVTKLTFSAVVAQIPKKFKNVKQQQIAALLLQGVSQSEISRAVGCTRQYISVIALRNRSFFESALL